MAGLGPKDERDGSVEYYLSEPVVSDEEKGVGVFMMAYGEYLKLEKENADFMELEKLTLGSLRKAVQDGDTVNGTLMAGQIAHVVNE